MSDNTTPAESPEAIKKEDSEHAKTLFDLLGYSQDEPAPVVPEVVATPAPAAVVEATPEPKVKKKVTVKAAEPAPVQPTVEEVVQRTLAEAQRPVVQAQPAAATTEVAPLDNFSEEEREEFEIAKYAESKDPKRAGLAQQVVEATKARREFIAKARAADADYEPDSDPEFRKLVSSTELKLSPTEKRRLFVQRETDAAEERAYTRVKAEMEAKHQGTQSQLREITERPKLAKKIEEVSADMFSDEEDPVFKAFVAKPEIAAEDYPLEAEILSGIKRETEHAASEYLAVRSGLKAYNPAEHAEINDFVVKQGDLFEKHGGKALTRDGKAFIHPAKWRPEHAATHWTFSEDDVLGAMRVEAARKAKVKISFENQKIERAIAARTKRSTPVVQSSATVTTGSDADSTSVRTGSAPMVDGQKVKWVEDPMAALLGYGT